MLHHPAGKSLRYLQPLTHSFHAGAVDGGGQKFPLAASLRSILSSARSETASRSRSFSFSSFLRRLAWEPTPPKLLPPIVVGSISNAEGFDRIHDLLALAEQDVGFPKLADDLFGTVTLLIHSYLLLEFEGA